MIIKYATVELDENEILKKMEDAYEAMAHAQAKIREAQEAVRQLKIKGNCGITFDTAKKEN